MVGLIAFLFPFNLVVVWTALSVMVVAGGCYLSLSILPTIFVECPYRTPFTVVINNTIIPTGAYAVNCLVLIMARALDVCRLPSAAGDYGSKV
jgi:hypothetical protein